MSATIGEYLVKSASIKSGSSEFKNKLRVIGDQFSTLEGLKKATVKKLNAAKNLEGQPLIKPFTKKETELFGAIKREINPRKTLEENFIVLLTSDFIGKQVTMLHSFDLDSMNTNPLLCSALKLDSVSDLVRYNVYAAATRSIVTSMGYLVENLLLFSNQDVRDGKYFAEGKSNKWDLVIERLDAVRYYVEVKSGPNDLDKTQIKSYNTEIKTVEEKGHKGFIGITYGRKDAKTVTTDLLRQYLDDWEAHTLIGTEFWDFVSENPDYHKVLMSTIKETATTMLRGKSIVKMIDKKVKELSDAFLGRYNSIDEYLTQLW